MKFELIDADKNITHIECNSIEEILNHDGFHITSLPARPMIDDKTVLPIDTDAVIQLLSRVRDSYRITVEEVNILKESFGVSQLEIGAISLHKQMLSDFGRKPQYYDLDGKRFFIGENIRQVRDSFKTSIGVELNPLEGAVLTRDGVDILSIEGNLVYCDRKCEADSITDLSARKLIKSSMILVYALRYIVHNLDCRNEDVCTHEAVDDLFVVSDVTTIRKIETELSELTQKLRQEAYDDEYYDYSDYTGHVVGLRNDKEHPLIIHGSNSLDRILALNEIAQKYQARDSGDDVSLFTLDNRTMNIAGALSENGIYVKVVSSSGDESEIFLEAGATYNTNDLMKVDLNNFIKRKEPKPAEFDSDYGF